MKIIRNVVGTLILLGGLFAVPDAKVLAFDPECSFDPYWELDPPPQRFTEECHFITSCDDADAACHEFCDGFFEGWFVEDSCIQTEDSSYGVCKCSWPHAR